MSFFTITFSAPDDNEYNGAEYRWGVYGDNEADVEAKFFRGEYADEADDFPTDFDYRSCEIVSVTQG